MNAKAFLEDLDWRGLIHASTDRATLEAHLDAAHLDAPRRFYIGFDPTADSLTVGNLLVMTLLLRGARAGLEPVVLFGGATGLIGDPSGKSEERRLLTPEQVGANVLGHQALFRRLFRDEREPLWRNNADWLGRLGAIELLRDVGKHVSVNEMLRRDSVRQRLERAEAGISYTEFSYALLQAFDFLQLFRTEQVTLQMGASDQWGNIVAGVDLVRKVCGAQAHGLTCPLLLRDDGSKFGKTERGAVWLSADRTSPFALQQFFINLPDDTAVRFAQYFSLRSRRALEELFAKAEGDRPARMVQHELADEIVARLHGPEERDRASAAAQALFSGEVDRLDAEALRQMTETLPVTTIPGERLADLTVVDALVATELAPSRRQAREFVEGGAVSVNGQRVTDDQPLDRTPSLEGGLFLLRRGKKRWAAVRIG